MRTPPSALGLTVLSFCLLASCRETGPMEPGFTELSVEDQLTLGLLADPSTSETALELASIQTSSAHRHGRAWGSNHDRRVQAEKSFREAEDALAQGNQTRALDRARNGRQEVAETIEFAGGMSAVVGMVERLEALPLFVNAVPDAFVNPGKLGLQLGKLAERARQALHAGDRTQAGALGVLAEQAFRHQHRHQHQVAASRAEIAVDLAAEAIELASSILSDQGNLANTEHKEILTTAEEFLLKAKEVLELGEDARASHLAHLAEWWALKAVVLPGGIADEEIRSLVTLAETLLVDAGIAVGPEPTHLQAALLEKARKMLERGKEAVGNGTCRGVGAIWQSAVTSSFLKG